MNRFLTRLLLSLMLVSSPAFAGGTLLLTGVGDTGVPPTPPSLSFCGTVADATNSATITFTAASVCAAGTPRFIVVAAYSNSGGISAVTVCGSSATLQIADVATVNVIYGILDNSANTTCNIVITKTAVAGTRIGVWALYNLNSTTPVNTQDNTNVSTPASCAVTLTTQAGGFAIASSFAANNPTRTSSWTNATVRYDALFTGTGLTAGLSGADGATAGASLTITDTYNAAPAACRLEAASYR